MGNTKPEMENRSHYRSSQSFFTSGLRVFGLRFTSFLGTDEKIDNLYKEGLGEVLKRRGSNLHNAARRSRFAGDDAQPSFSLLLWGFPAVLLQPL